LRTLHALFFRSHVGPTLNHPDTEVLGEFYTTGVLKKGTCDTRRLSSYSSPITEAWKIAQRWRSITASSIASLVDPDDWTASIEHVAELLRSELLQGLCRSTTDVADIHVTIYKGLQKLYKQAFDLSTMATRDFLSDRILVVEAPPSQDMPSVDPQLVEVQWPDMGNLQANHVIGTYSFGLVKMEASGQKTVLLRPKVVTDGVLAHVAAHTTMESSVG
jgi:hypothetical protein